MKVALLFVTLTCLGLTQAIYIPNVAESEQCQACKMGIEFLKLALDFGLDDKAVQQAVISICNVIATSDLSRENCVEALTQISTKLIEDVKTKTAEEVCISRNFCGDDA